MRRFRCEDKRPAIPHLTESVGRTLGTLGTRVGDTDGAAVGRRVGIELGTGVRKALDGTAVDRSVVGLSEVELSSGAAVRAVGMIVLGAAVLGTAVLGVAVLGVAVLGTTVLQPRTALSAQPRVVPLFEKGASRSMQLQAQFRMAEPDGIPWCGRARRRRARDRRAGRRRARDRRARDRRAATRDRTFSGPASGCAPL
jgi:hypothetical protein